MREFAAHRCRHGFNQRLKPLRACTIELAKQMLGNGTGFFVEPIVHDKTPVSPEVGQMNLNRLRSGKRREGGLAAVVKLICMRRLSADMAAAPTPRRI